MERSKLDWKTFSSRRRLDVRAWIEYKGFKKISDMEKWLTDRNMEPPKKEEVSEFFKKAPKKEIVKEEILEPVLKDVEQKEEATKEAPLVFEIGKSEIASFKKKGSKKRVDSDTEK
jgi:hypothetical protein